MNLLRLFSCPREAQSNWEVGTINSPYILRVRNRNRNLIISCLTSHFLLHISFVCELGTMRLGSRTTVLRQGSFAASLYSDREEVNERHRHRYEVNPKLIGAFEEGGLQFSGKDTTGERMEIIELSQQEHPYFIATQFHPEYKSRPLRPGR